MRTKEEELRGKQKHFDEFEALAQKIGVPLIREILPASEAEIKSALDSGDYYLNTIPLKHWDWSAIGTGERPPLHKIFLYLPSDYRARPDNLFYGMGLSLCDRVCVLKHVARHHVAGHPRPT